MKVYVDAVINHMTGQGDTSYGGVTLRRASTTRCRLDSTANFHHKYSGDCPSATGGIEDFNNKQQVFNCELVGLADLDTDTDVGARPAGDVPQQADRLRRLRASGSTRPSTSARPTSTRSTSGCTDTRDGTRPYWALEVFGGGPGTLSPEAFTRSGDVLGLDGVKQLKSAFKSYPADATGQHRDAEGLR